MNISNYTVLKYVFLQGVVSILIGIAYFAVQAQRNSMNQKPGAVIFLNGPSASGKSSIQKAFQELSPRPFLKMGLDSLFVAPIPEKYILGKTSDATSILKGTASRDAQGPLFILKIGEQGQKIITGMHRAIVDYARAGNNVIVDYILYEQSWLQDIEKLFKDIPVYWVGIHIDLKELERREKKRNTSPQGHARSHYSTVHDNCTYDLVIDVTKRKSEESAQLILDYINQHPK